MCINVRQRICAIYIFIYIAHIYVCNLPKIYICVFTSLCSLTQYCSNLQAIHFILKEQNLASRSGLNGQRLVATCYVYIACIPALTLVIGSPHSMTGEPWSDFLGRCLLWPSSLINSRSR